MKDPRPTTLGQLRERRDLYSPRGVRDELRYNLIVKLRAREELFPGIVGYQETVIPQVVNAVLARHDMIFLGLRGQAKTRVCRMLTLLLDEALPAVPGCPLNSHPLAPEGLYARRRVADAGDTLPIEWLTRDQRYGEKLATPDVTMADLIGDIDPLKAAHRKLDLSDEEVMHFGIIPRTNRGIFVINELPDLAPRIQVGLLNILEERDIQIRGFPVRIPLDILLVFTANPEDYTNRGSIITPLKDRIASQILTHYPRHLEDSHTISRGEGWFERGDELPRVEIPHFLSDIVEEVAFHGRDSEYVDQTSGVSARLPIAARELLVSQVERRQLEIAGAGPVARLVDLGQLIPAITGKIELVYEGEQEGALRVARHLLGAACRSTFDRHFPDIIREGSGSGAESKVDRYKPVLDWFASGNSLEVADSMEDTCYRTTLEKVPGLAALVDECLPSDAPMIRAAAMELVLEGLHQHSMLAKEDVERGASYSDMLGVMMEGLR